MSRKYTKEYLTEIVNKSNFGWEVIQNLGIKKTQGNLSYVNKLIKKFNINTSHFENQHGKNTTKKSLSKYLVKGKFLTLSGNRFKERLYRKGLKDPICELCGQDENWKGKKISLILDHIDGDRKNNLLENLRIVCPNCNATLPTHGGKNMMGGFKERERFKIKRKRKIREEKNEEKLKLINKWESKIKKNNIDFSKKTWGVEVSKLMNYTPQYCLKFVKKNLSHLIEK